MLSPSIAGDENSAINYPQHWLVELPETEESIKRQSNSHQSNVLSPKNIAEKCGTRVDAIAQWFVRYGTRAGGRVTPKRADYLLAFLAVLATFETFFILYLLKAYESCL